MSVHGNKGPSPIRKKLVKGTAVLSPYGQRKQEATNAGQCITEHNHTTLFAIGSPVPVTSSGSHALVTVLGLPILRKKVPRKDFPVSPEEKKAMQAHISP